MLTLEISVSRQGWQSSTSEFRAVPPRGQIATAASSVTWLPSSWAQGKNKKVMSLFWKHTVWILWTLLIKTFLCLQRWILVLKIWSCLPANMEQLILKPSVPVQPKSWNREAFHVLKLYITSKVFWNCLIRSKNVWNCIKCTTFWNSQSELHL